MVKSFKELGEAFAADRLNKEAAARAESNAADAAKEAAQQRARDIAKEHAVFKGTVLGVLTDAVRELKEGGAPVSDVIDVDALKVSSLDGYYLSIGEYRYKYFALFLLSGHTKIGFAVGAQQGVTHKELALVVAPRESFLQHRSFGEFIPTHKTVTEEEIRHVVYNMVRAHTPSSS